MRVLRPPREICQITNTRLSDGMRGGRSMTTRAAFTGTVRAPSGGAHPSWRKNNGTSRSQKTSALISNPASRPATPHWAPPLARLATRHPRPMSRRGRALRASRRCSAYDYNAAIGLLQSVLTLYPERRNCGSRVRCISASASARLPRGRRAGDDLGASVCGDPGDQHGPAAIPSEALPASAARATDERRPQRPRPLHAGGGPCAARRIRRSGRRTSNAPSLLSGDSRARPARRRPSKPLSAAMTTPSGPPSRPPSSARAARPAPPVQRQIGTIIVLSMSTLRRRPCRGQGHTHEVRAPESGAPRRRRRPADDRSRPRYRICARAGEQRPSSSGIGRTRCNALAGRPQAHTFVTQGAAASSGRRTLCSAPSRLSRATRATCCGCSPATCRSSARSTLERHHRDRHLAARAPRATVLTATVAELGVRLRPHRPDGARRFAHL